MKTETNRIEVAGQGLGEVSADMVHQRATELARMDGRDTPHEGDMVAAKKELQGEMASVPETPGSLRDVTAWDESPNDSGTQVMRTPLEDEENIALGLVQEGLEEAEHDRRVEASRNPERDL